MSSNHNWGTYGHVWLAVCEYEHCLCMCAFTSVHVYIFMSKCLQLGVCKQLTSAYMYLSPWQQSYTTPRLIYAIQTHQQLRFWVNGLQPITNQRECLYMRFGMCSSGCETEVVFALTMHTLCVDLFQLAWHIDDVFWSYKLVSQCDVVMIVWISKTDLSGQGFSINGGGSHLQCAAI